MRTLIYALLVLLFAVPALHAATVNVSSLSALQTAINNAAPGDIIILANGVYTASTDISISKQGTATAPITIQAQTIGGAEINGTAGFNIVSPAKYIIIKGFRFTFNASQATMASGTSFCRWTRNIFQNPGEGEDLLLNGNDHEVDYNTFQHKDALGRFIAVRGSGSQIAQRLHIHHNYFLDQQPQSGNGAETVQFGLSGYSLSSSNSIFEYNLFEDCDGENELLSVKSSAVTVRYNTIRNCPAQFTLRHGNHCTVYGNYFINTPGIRIFGDDHLIFSNHFENCNPAINIGNGDGEVADGAALTSHDRPDRCVIVFNTLVNNTTNYVQSGRTDGLGATNTTFANNIIQGGGPAASIAGPYTGAVWSNNILYQTNGAGAMPSGGYTTTNPLLARDATGTFHLQSGSPAIDAATGSYTGATVDMDGQSRSGTKDIGADEVSTAPVIAQILTTAMVGYNGSETTTPACVPVSASGDDGNVPANVLDNDLNTRWSASGDGQWIQFCLGSATTISGVQIAFYQGNTRTSSFDVQTGNDGQSWTNALTNVQSSGTSLNLETFSFTAHTAKYVRILGHGNSVNAWNSYTEVKIQTGTGGTNQQFTLLPTQDAYVRDGANATITHGTADSTLLITKVNPSATTGNNRETYLLFNAAAVSGTINSVQLKVYGKTDLTTIASVPVGVFSVSTTSWTENSLTWNNKPASGATELAAADISSAAYDYAIWDVTNYVKSEIAAGRTTISLALKSLASSDSRVLFNSAETGSNPPQLVIDATTSAQRMVVGELINQSINPETGTTLNSYPNPFHTANTITFNLEKETKVQLSVVDVMGRQVALLVNGNLMAGLHRTTFDAKQLPTGMYWVRLLTNGKSMMKPIIKQ